MISAFGRLRRDRPWCDLGFGQSASVYLRRASFLDQNSRLSSTGDVKTCWFIIKYSRLTPDSLKIRFFVQIDFFAAHGGQGGVNGGSEGTKDLLDIGMVPEQRCPIWSIHSTKFRQLYDITRVPHDITG